MLTIAKVILPETDNEGNEAAHAHKWLKSTLLASFGGYTVIPVSGAWIDEGGTVYEDESLRYEVAIEPTAVNMARFVQIASEAGRIAGQLAVFIEAGSTAQIIDLTVGKLAAPVHANTNAPTPAGGFTL